MKPNKKIIEKLKILSELSYDNQVLISEKGNYFVHLHPPHQIDTKVELRPQTVTRGTIDKLFVERPVKYERYLRTLMITKNGRVLVSEGGSSGNRYKINIKWHSLIPSNFHKKGRWVTCQGKSDKFVREHVTKLVFANSKAKWLLDMPFWTLDNAIEHKIVLNYSSLTELRKDLGYTFLSDKSFCNLLTHIEEIDVYTSKSDKRKEMVNLSYVSNLFTLLLYGKFFSLQSRKNLVIILLNLFATQQESHIEESIRELVTDFTNYIKIRKADGNPMMELPNNIKDLTSDLLVDLSTNTDSDNDEDLPF